MLRRFVSDAEGLHRNSDNARYNKYGRLSPTAPFIVYEDEVSSSSSTSREAENAENHMNGRETGFHMEEMADANNATGTPGQALSTQKKKTRKRQRQPQLWKRSQKKEAVEKGLKYTSKSGKEIPAKKMGGGCGLGCRNHCHMKIKREERQKSFSTFWSLKKERKYAFIRNTRWKRNQMKGSPVTPIVSGKSPAFIIFR